MIGFRINFKLPFLEQLNFFKQKGIKLSSESWRDVWQQAHSRAFTVARVLAMDVLVDLKAAITEAIETGITLAQFKKTVKETLEAKGWLAQKGEAAQVIMPDGSTRKRLTGHRLDTIYRQNLNTSYQVGRYKQMADVKALRPFWQYMTADDVAVRDEHAALHGKVYHADHPIWDTYYPPNDFNCRCYVKTLSVRQLKQRGLKEETKGVKDKPAEGWRYNVGKSGLDAWRPDAAEYPEELKQIVRSTERGSEVL